MQSRWNNTQEKTGEQNTNKTGKIVWSCWMCVSLHTSVYHYTQPECVYHITQPSFVSTLAEEADAHVAKTKQKKKPN